MTSTVRYTHTHTQTQTHTNIHTYTQTHTHTHTHTPGGEEGGVNGASCTSVYNNVGSVSSVASAGVGFRVRG